MVISGCGGKVFYDPMPTVRYRQHENNLVGMNTSWSARVKRIRMLWQGKFRFWNDQNIIALQSIQEKLLPENLKLLNEFSEARNMWLLPRLINLKRAGIYRQTFLGNLGLVVAVVFNKL